VQLLTLLAQETGTKSLWNPTLLGVLVVLSAIGLFCGSVYLLLATNLGARLGFLVASACLFGFLVLLSILWMTTFTPLESPKGRDAKWKVKEVVTGLDKSKIADVRNIAQNGTPIPTSDIGTIRPAIDGAFVTPATPPTPPATSSPFAKYTASSNYLTGEQGLKAYTVGGGTKNVFWHYPKYAAIEFCQIEVVNTPFGEKPPAPVCDALVPPGYAILERDLGSLRQPPIFYFIVFSLLFGLSLLGLHWYELDERERKRAELVPAT
jgi:hypothetical protein